MSRATLMNQTHHTIKPWRELRVLDLSQGLAGPYCAQILASQGADVIKAEPPAGDWGRFVGQLWVNHSAISLQYNQGKRGIAVDARNPKGQQLLREIASQCDVVVQNFRPGVVQRLGLDYDTLSIDNPTLVYVSISGYGADGPYADRPASDSVMQADSGLMFTNRTPDDDPRRVGVLLADVSTGLFAAQAVSAALYHRLNTGDGSHVQTSLFESSLAMQAMQLLAHSLVGTQPVSAVSAPNGVFHTSDGRMSILALNDDHFARLARALEQQKWLSEEKFESNAKRLENKHAIHNEVQAIVKHWQTDALETRLREHEVLHAVVSDHDRLANHPQAHHLGVAQEFTTQGVGTYQMIAYPAAIFGRQTTPAPHIGEHTWDVLREFGFDAKRLQELLAEGVLAQYSEAA